MIAALRVPLVVWLATSAILVVIGTQVEYGAIVAGLYVALNALGMGIVLSREPPYEVTPLKVMAWCAAAQLPVMIVPLFDRDLTGVAHRARAMRSEPPGDGVRRENPDRSELDR